MRSELRRASFLAGFVLTIGCSLSSAFGQAPGTPAGSSGGDGASATGGDSAAAASGTNAPAEPTTVEPFRDPNDPLQPYFDAKRRLRDKYGTRVGLNIDLTDQLVLTGPANVFNRGVARYDFNVNQLFWKGAEADLVVRGGWGDGPDVVLDNTVNTNQYARTGEQMFVLHLWFQQKLFNDQLTLRLGKMDLGDWMDTNRYGFYNFVGYSFAHNSSIPLPGNPLAAMFTVEPKATPWVYVSSGIANASQSSFEAGFEELFDGPSDVFSLSEIGFKPKFNGLQGIYRFNFWYDARDLIEIDGTGVDAARWGLSVSFDQDVSKRLGLFFRYGWGNQAEFTPMQYVSAGFDLKAPFPSRPRDDFAVGVVHNIFADERDAVVDGPADYETYVEAYYNAFITQWLQLQPMLQVVTNPGGQDRSTEVILGVHALLRF